ncbi:hypothetical protein DMN91_007124 [Ooceraea biroi]|uniref:Uncharacterized protein n=1 Tax=Ooceraea biroi TaxID=2015173 RepID=A0A026WNC7_OOCBI|nr:uncharacterized protein LOC105277623 [Ooceraea biroi]EZA57136.1 hypothetical protein X777_01742 [Ooceraea biroi]RLU20514.1 hypothetical protein DMN91_007124 [Ooceraea biroi]
MDTDILRIILSSCGGAGNAQCEDYKDVSRETLLSLESDTVLNTLCTSLSNLLCCKVSREAYQRYSVRLLIIDILRKWCRTTNNFEHLQIFTSKENSLKFVSILLDKYLTDDVLSECYSEDALISLTSAVIHLSIDNPSFMHHLDRLLVTLSQLETNDKIDKFLQSVLSSNLRLKLSTREQIYASQKFKLIEEPLLNGFALASSDSNKEDCANDQSNELTLNRLLEFSAESACVFQLTFNFLKELLVQLQYAPLVLDFTKSMLKRVSAYCENHGRDILDLYPRKLRSCIILLRIEPRHHTMQTRDYTLQTMKQIFNENKDVLLILMSHFPQWLEYFASYVANDARS